MSSQTISNNAIGCQEFSREKTPSAATPAPRALLQKLGLAGFLFFFAKGLCWLLLPLLLAWAAG